MATHTTQGKRGGAGRTKEAFSRASPALVKLRVEGLLPATTLRSQERVAHLKHIFLSPLTDVKRTQSVAVDEVLLRLRLTQSVRNLKMCPAAEGSSNSVVGALCMPFTTCCAVPARSLDPTAPGDRQSSLVWTGAVDGLLTLWDTQRSQPLHSESTCDGNTWGRVRSIAAHPVDPVCFTTTMFHRHLSAWRIQVDGVDNDESDCSRRYHFTPLSARVPDTREDGGSPSPALHIAQINQLAVDPSGHLLASSSDDATLRLWDVHALRETWTSADAHLVTHDGYETVGSVLGVAFHPDGSLVSTTDSGGRVVSWDTRTGRHAFSTGGAHGGHLRRAGCLAWSPCGVRLASGGVDGAIHLWDARLLYREQNTSTPGIGSGTASAPYMMLGHEDAVTSLSFYTNPIGDGGLLGSTVPVALLSTSLDHTIRAWDLDTGLCARSLDSGAPVYQHCRPTTVDPNDASRRRQTAIFSVGHSKYWAMWDVVSDEATFELLVKETEELATGSHTMSVTTPELGAEGVEGDSSEEDEMMLLRRVA